jgi:hypothetical protein
MNTPTSAKSAKQKLIEEQVVASLVRPKSGKREIKRRVIDLKTPKKRTYSLVVANLPFITTIYVLYVLIKI